MKNHLFIRKCIGLFFLCMITQTFAQCPSGDVSLTSQAEIDAWIAQYPNCTEIEGDFEIGDLFGSESSDISDLNGFAQITSVGGNLYVSKNNALTSLHGLHNITSVGASLGIYRNNSLTSLNGLQNITSVGGGLIVRYNEALTSLNELQNITSVGHNLEVIGNIALTNLNGLHNITSVGNILKVSENDALLNLTGLESLTTINYSLTISVNNAMTNLDGIPALRNVHTISLISNNVLENIEGLANINVNPYLQSFQVVFNPALSTCNNEGICAYLSDASNHTNIHSNAEGCNSREEIQISCSQDISAPANDDFANAEAISCGDVIAGDTTYATLDEDDAPDADSPFLGDMDSPNVWYSYTGSGIAESITLSTCDDATFDTSILVYTGTSGNLTLIAYNDDGANCSGYTSSVTFDSDGSTTYYFVVEGFNSDDIGTFNLSLTCETMGVNEIDASKPKFTLYPNPTSDILHIQGGEVSDIKVYTVSGKRVNATYQNDVINMRGFADGIYVIRFTDKQGNVVTQKFIKK